MKKLLLLGSLLAFGLAGNAFGADTPRASTGNVISGGQIWTWTGLDGDDTGIPVDVAKCKWLTAHIYSSTYGGSTITLQGSNDPVAGTASYASAEWAGLADNSGTAISKTADAIERVEEQPRYFRPVTSAGTAANIAVGLHCQY